MGSALRSGQPRANEAQETASAATALADHPDQNARFYANAMRCVPDDVLISELHAAFNHEQLERNHGFVQWLFPVYENQGMNPFSAPLTKAGAAAIRNDLDASRRVVGSYRLMLDFYGCRLVDERTGELARADNYAERYAAMNFAFNHNWLRISRIIVSLGELGFGRYKRPLLDHLRREVELGTLGAARQSCETFWVRLVEDEDTPAYRQKTREDGPEDRGVSAYLAQLDAERSA